MDPTRAARRDLVLTAVVLIGLSRLAEGPLLWVAAGIVLVAVALGALSVLADTDPRLETEGVPIESVLVPAVAAAACVGAIRLIPVGPAIAPALVAAWLLVERPLVLEARILAAAHGPTPEDRTTLLVQELIVSFVAFAGVAALVPGGLPEVGAGLDAAGATPLSEGNLLLLAGADALVAFLLGYRVSALRATSARDVLWSASTYATAVAIGAAALRAMTIPRLIGPALLTLVFFLWDAFHGAPPSRRRDPRWIWQTGLLVVLGVAVIIWNLGLRS